MNLRDAFRTDFQVEDSALAGHNNFHLIRLGAALLVLFAHCFHLLDRAGEEPIGRWFVWLDASLLGVAVFFYISGFLVARSWDARRSLAGFLTARALRIAPALWLVLAVSVFCVGAAFTSLPLAAYFYDADTRKYLVLNAVLYTHYLLPGVFESNPVPGINGSLWTIPLEVVLYLILGVAGWIGLLGTHGAVRQVYERVTRFPLASVFLILFGLLLVNRVLWTGAQYYSLAGYFLLGVLGYRFRQMVGWRLEQVVLLVMIAVAAARTQAGPVLLPAALAYAILTLALHPAFKTPVTWLHRHDYSYGTYLWGFPVQQALIALGIREPLLLFACCVPLTLGCAAVSWHLVELPALNQKGRVSGWVTHWSARPPRGE